MKRNKRLITYIRGLGNAAAVNAEARSGLFSGLKSAKTGRILMIAGLIAVMFAGSARESGYASDASLNASVTPEKGSVGQPFSYTLTISGIDPSAIKITLPEKKVVYPEKKKETEDNKKSGGKDGKTGSGDDEKPSEEFVPVYIINSAARDDSEVNGTRQVNIKIILTYYRPGSYTLPEVRIAGADGVNIGYRVPSVTIEEINKEGKLEEIEPPVSLAGNYTRLIWLIAAIIAAAVIAALLYRYIKNRKKPEAPEAPAVPPIEIFLKEVEALKLRESIQNGRINKYVFDISIIFRRYLSSMLMFDAAEMTTDEIASGIKKYMPRDIYSECGEMILSNMRLWDFSKFAEFAPSAELLVENLDATISVAKRISGMMTSQEAEGIPGNEGGENGTVRV